MNVSPVLSNVPVFTGDKPIIFLSELKEQFASCSQGDDGLNEHSHRRDAKRNDHP